MDAFNRNNKEMKLSTVSAIGTAMTALVTPALLAVSVAGVALATSAQEAKSRSYGLNVNGSMHRITGNGVRTGHGIYSF